MRVDPVSEVRQDVMLPADEKPFHMPLPSRIGQKQAYGALLHPLLH